MKRYYHLLFLTLLAVFFLETQFAYACNCNASATIDQKSFDSADIVFSGKAVSRTDKASAKGIEFEVQKFWKGELSTHVVVYTGGECGVSFVNGNTYIVVARKSGDQYETSRCMPTKGITRASADLKFLNKIKPLTANTNGPAGTDIWLYDLSINDLIVKVGAGQQIVARPGYDNQPCFSATGKHVFFTSMRGNQTDIFRYSIETKETSRITNTPESEYSPLVMPDKISLSVVRVEADSTQRLWKFPIKGGEPELISKKLKGIGYHTWIGSNNFAFFQIDPNDKKKSSLHTSSLYSKSSQHIHDNIGRCLQKVPGHSALSFVSKQPQKPMEIYEMNIYTLAISKVINTLDGAEDFVWTPDGILLMAQGNKLYRHHPERDEKWVEIHTFSNLKNITRLAIDKTGTRLAVVADE